MHPNAARRILVFQDPGEVAQQAAGFIESLLEGKSKFSLALCGGSTPKQLYSCLAGRQLPWQKMYFFLTDERWVSHKDPRSNYRMMQESLFSKAAIAQDHIYPVPTNQSRPEKSAAAYEQNLRSYFNPQAGDFPVFDLVILGIGEDGHTASLFPGDPVLKENKKWMAASLLNSEEPRVTLTYPVINQARHILFLAVGASKRPIVERVLGQNPGEGEASCPAQNIQPCNGTLTWMLDTQSKTG